MRERDGERKMRDRDGDGSGGEMEGDKGERYRQISKRDGER